MKLSLEEKETIICFNEKEDEAHVYTFNPRLIRRIEEVSMQTGQKVKRKEPGYGEVEFYIPKKWVTFFAPHKLNLTEEQREQRRQSMKAIHERRKANGRKG